jgi:hypothetical protein
VGASADVAAGEAGFFFQNLNMGWREAWGPQWYQQARPDPPGAGLAGGGKS